MTTTVKYGIVGGGLAGVMTARALLEHGVPGGEISIWDTFHEDAGSGNTGAILHAFPAGSVRPTTENALAFPRASKAIDKFATEYPETIHRTSMLRVITDPDDSRLLRSFHRHRGEHAEWLAPRRFTGQFPDIVDWPHGELEGLLYGPAYVINLDALVDRLLESLSRSGVAVHNTEVDQIDYRDNSIELLPPSPSKKIRVEKLVLCPGVELPNLFPDVPVQVAGVEVVVSKPVAPDLDCITNAGVHVAQLPDDRLAIGSTWCDPEQLANRTPEDVRADLAERATVCTDLVENIEIDEVFSGIRINDSRTHRPMVGPVPGLADTYVLSTLGGKGLIWAPLLAAGLAELMTAGDTEKLPEPALSTRLPNADWHPADHFVRRIGI